MKRACTLMLLFLFVSLPAMAADEEKELGFWFETRVDTKHEVEAIGWYERQITEVIGIYGLASMENSDRYRQFYGGVTVKPLPTLAPWLQLGVGLGRARDGESDGVRRNAFFAIDNDRVHVFATYENGVTGPWHRINGVYHVNDTFSVGAMQETNHGGAPRVEYHIKKNLTVWGAVFRDRTVFAINYSY